MKFLGRCLTAVLLLSSISPLLAAADVRVTCTPSSASELPFERDYRILTSKTDIDETSVSSYQGERRLKGRAFWDADQRIFVIPYSGAMVQIPRNFADSLALHFAKALENRYADAIIYPDMGHAHLMLPTKEWTALKALTEDKFLRLEKALASPNLKALYHAAEMLQIKEGDFAKGRMPQDPWKLWRYFSRNLFGAFQAPQNLEILWAGPQALYNTVRDVPGMVEFTTLYFVSNKSGCFPFQSPEGPKFFDMTFEIIPYQKSN